MSQQRGKISRNLHPGSQDAIVCDCASLVNMRRRNNVATVERHQECQKNVDERLHGNTHSHTHTHTHTEREREREREREKFQLNNTITNFISNCWFLLAMDTDTQIHIIITSIIISRTLTYNLHFSTIFLLSLLFRSRCWCRIG